MCQAPSVRIINDSAQFLSRRWAGSFDLFKYKTPRGIIHRVGFLVDVGIVNLTRPLTSETGTSHLKKLTKYLEVNLKKCNFAAVINA